jgi:hypothetical protein
MDCCEQDIGTWRSVMGCCEEDFGTWRLVMDCCEKDKGTWRSVMGCCEGISDKFFVINDREILQILSDCEFRTKAYALRICLLTSPYYPCRGQDSCYPMNSRERC